MANIELKIQYLSKHRITDDIVEFREKYLGWRICKVAASMLPRAKYKYHTIYS